MDLVDKVVVITGASSGLGAAVARKLAPMGCKLVLVAQDQDKLQKVATELQDQAAVTALQLDLTEDIAAEKILQTTLKTYGALDILVSNAGIWTDNELEAKDPGRVRKAFEVNSIAAIRLIQTVVSHMQEKEKGHVLSVVSSAGASDTESGNNEAWMAYGATKWAMTGFMKALTKNLEQTAIRTTTFQPGGFESDLYENAGGAGGAGVHDQSWMMKTDDVADALIFCLTRPVDVQIERILVTKKQ